MDLINQEWISSTPKHLILYRAFGWTPPQFAHLPLLLDKDRSKLSKRMGSVQVEKFKESGYLPEAVVNYVATLGWTPSDVSKRVLSAEELAEDVSLCEREHQRDGRVFFA
jgi:glutamyl-tRNA synthetase